MRVSSRSCHRDRSISSRNRSNRGPRDWNYDQSPSFVRCGSLARSRTVRAVWNARGERRYSQSPASVSVLSWCIPSSSSPSAETPSGFVHDNRPCEPLVAIADPPRCTCCALEEPITKTFRPLTSSVALRARCSGSNAGSPLPLHDPRESYPGLTRSA